mgnify:CR=1 FL=1
MDPTHGIELWFASMAGNPLLIFQGVALCVLVYALVGMARRYDALLPRAIETIERSTSALEALEKSVDTNTAAMERLKDSIRWRGEPP